MGMSRKNYGRKIRNTFLFLYFAVMIHLLIDHVRIYGGLICLNYQCTIAYIWTQIFVKSYFTMKGTSVKIAILNCFARQDPIYHHAKFHLLLRPPSSFCEFFFEIIDKFCLLISLMCKIWVITASNKHFLEVWD